MRSVSATTSAAASGQNLQTFTGALGGVTAPAVTAGGTGFVVQGSDSFVNLPAALGRPCDIQHNQCADAANSGSASGLTKLELVWTMPRVFQGFENDVVLAMESSSDSRLPKDDSELAEVIHDDAEVDKPTIYPHRTTHQYQFYAYPPETMHNFETTLFINGEFTPASSGQTLSATYIAQLTVEAGFPPGLINIISGRMYTGILFAGPELKRQCPGVVLEDVDACAKEIGCIGINVEKKYYELESSTGDVFVKRTLSPREWLIDIKGNLVVPFMQLERIKNEVAAIKYIKENTNFPVPTIRCHFEDNGCYYIIMDAVPGTSMVNLAEDQRKVVIEELKGYIKTMQGVKSKVMGSFTSDICLPYRLAKVLPQDKPKKFKAASTEQFVLCHNDLGHSNIIVDEKTLKINAIVNWEYVGFYPEEMEKAFYMRKHFAILLEDEHDGVPHLLDIYSNAVTFDTQEVTLIVGSIQTTMNPASSRTEITRWVSNAWMIDMRTDSGEVQHDGFELQLDVPSAQLARRGGELEYWSVGATQRRVRLTMRPAQNLKKNDLKRVDEDSYDNKEGREKSRSALDQFLGESNRVWKGDEKDWARCHTLLRRLGTDGVKLELWRAWLGLYDCDSTSMTSTSVKGKEVASEPNPNEDEKATTPPSTEPFNEPSRKKNDTILQGFELPDSRARYLTLLHKAGLLGPSDAGRASYMTLSQVCFWSYASDLGGKRMEKEEEILRV
ncbi:hypothetical protein SERLADRAFT_408903 [Serpula lacrymans var. lacrymans S7.9]|uniref:Aminoglycoside phosphotransferase domain-containing protein n=1 Tax=Serpula lacrymans var. lacrymans (strain S7.9) TaxID=578457 RepID=F8P0J9_SERL9|nr:uncharacterized protein SERLADRAFT_408903 [Serpula lacrymans var. lacrymans S7.9]EGO23554.1 hypothetical protein SERLADRAFT_408903 [Serpula lacrymans var. lacrymans S7.9]